MMLKALLILCCICAATAIDATQKRIIDGTTISIEEAPYQVSIIDKSRGSHSCGGSIISANYLLTAAHCTSKSAQEYEIRSGSSFSAKAGTLHNVTKIIQHQGYKAEFLVGVPIHDIALMRVSPPFELNAGHAVTKKIALFNSGQKAEAGDEALLTGWGAEASGESVSHAASQLQSLKLELLNVKMCSIYYIDRGGIAWNQICAKHALELRRDMCNGDSGGPLVHVLSGKQVGIVSWSGPGCAQAGRPGVYTEVAAYRGWIDRHVDA